MGGVVVECWEIIYLIVKYSREYELEVKWGNIIL